MSKRLNKKSILTIPNAMSLLRLLLIPLYLWLYCVKDQYIWALAVLIVSGITDMLDGFVARHFHQESDIGKLLDPIADKLTQAALIISLAGRYPQIWLLFALFAVKELIVAFTALAVLVKTDTMNSAKWFGKLSTFVLEVSMAILIVFPVLPAAFVNALFIITGTILLFAGVSYTVLYIRMIRDHKHQSNH